MIKLCDENNALSHENINLKSHFEACKVKNDVVCNESENHSLRDELNETKKKLEHVELKCTTYSQKFELLMNKYESRKTKQKAKVEKIWQVKKNF